jgi:hypothetical protein
MRDQRTRSTTTDVSAAAADRRDQLGVLVTVIDLHPVQVTVPELIRELARDPHEFGERDRVERAVRDLSGCGLLHLIQPNALLLPTRAALCASELLMEEAGSDV